MRCLSIVIACVACSAEAGDDGTCSPTDDCAGGFACSVTHTGDGSGECLPADGDVDGDGLPNERDYCNASEGGEYDEDRDLIGDACDRCPIAQPPASPDPDGDEVDSPCDPDPRTPGDRIVAFEGFRAGVPPTWTATGTWMHAGGDVIAMAGPTPATLTTALPLSATNMAVLVQYRIDAVEAGTRAFAGLVARDVRPASMAAARCGSSRNPVSGDSLSLETDTQIMTTPIVDAFDSASLYSVAMRVEGVQSGCAMIADATEVAAQAAISGEVLSEAGIIVQSATARFTYALAIQRGPVAQP